MPSWSAYFVYRREAWRTTWAARLMAVAAAGLLLATTRGYWIHATAQSLICTPDRPPATVDAVIIENFEVEYPLFPEAAQFQSRGARVLVPVTVSSDGRTPNLVSARIVQVMADVARLHDVELIPVSETEPVVLTVAHRIRRFLDREQIRSVAVIVPAFRSRRSALVYKRVFGESHIAVACVPVLRNTAPDAWPSTWHGVQQVAEQFIKLQYYRFYVLPFAAEKSPRQASIDELE